MARLETRPQYVFAAQQQLADAAELLQHPTLDAFDGSAHSRHLAGAMYLAGYAVECSLKEYLLRKYEVMVTPAPGASVTLDEILPYIQADTGMDLHRTLHSLSDLWLASGLDGRDMTMTQNLGLCAIWRVEWRYSPPAGKARQDAEQFQSAADNLVAWISGQKP